MSITRKRHKKGTEITRKWHVNVIVCLKYYCYNLIQRGEIMTDIELKIDAEPKDNYEKAKKLLFETDKAIQTLTTQEQQKLVVEFAEYKGMYGLYQMMQQYFG